jgi:D-lactate dehydrogenase
VFYIGTNRPDELTEIRRHALHDFKHLPISGEYLHRDAFDIAEEYGKDTFLAINYLGTSRLPALFGLKSRFDALFDRLGFFLRISPTASCRLRAGFSQAICRRA